MRIYIAYIVVSNLKNYLILCLGQGMCKLYLRLQRSWNSLALDGVFKAKVEPIRVQ